MNKTIATIFLTFFLNSDKYQEQTIINQPKETKPIEQIIEITNTQTKLLEFYRTMKNYTILYTQEKFTENTRKQLKIKIKECEDSTKKYEQKLSNKISEYIKNR
ncbi:hypothetical protein K9L97_04100 [Candidatus Woesearchaeota archaeon]|nr:hypothetical protein [Candidatus Woesearchaeota archaeon]